ncbi:MAG TPA: heavy metal-associated domain-containing protein [Bacteroidota bacterium]|nr:heavy metal-associated domain-containing protein [Bacteroidota bacterium]
MKRYLGIFLGLILTITVVNTAVKAEANLQTVQIKTSAVCESCKTRIEKAVNKLQGVEKSDLDLSTKILTISYDPAKVSVEKIKNTISKTGYSADEIKADKKAFDKLPACCKVKPEGK